ncbi:MAG: hypothetical protein WC989_03330 [Micavibrio sp.]
MVYPVSNPLAQQQQIPASNTFQPGGSDSARRAEENKNADATRQQGAEAARSEAASNRNAENFQAARTDENARDSGGIYSSTSRGTQLDITA